MIDKINAVVWGIPGLVLLLGVGLYLTWNTKFVQIRLLLPALKSMLSQLRGNGEEENTQLKSLCTALAATVGTGNIAGVAGAIAIGGPGAVFWMWVSGFIGMATKYAEASLAVIFSQRKENGERVGGPMYMIRNGLNRHFRPMAAMYAFFGIIASLGVGNAAQINAVFGALTAAADGFEIELEQAHRWMIGAVLAVAVFLMVSGGASKIGTAAELLVPFASVVYILLCLGVLIIRFPYLGNAFRSIFLGAFTPSAVTGGAVGSMFLAVRLGVSRGVFSNEAGMGTAAIAHAGACVDHPAQQGMMGIVEVFIDTIIICTMTALVILVSGVSVPYGTDIGSELTANALRVCYGPWVTVLLSLCLCCFAFATVLGWGLYAGRCVEYLLGRINWRIFGLFQAAGVFLGATVQTDIVWGFSEMVNGLMAVPNLLALLLLSQQVKKLTNEFCCRAKPRRKFCSGLSRQNVV